MEKGRLLTCPLFLNYEVTQMSKNQRERFGISDK